MQIVSRLAYQPSETSMFVGFGGAGGKKKRYSAVGSSSSYVKSFLILIVFLLTLSEAFPTDCALERKHTHG